MVESETHIRFGELPDHVRQAPWVRGYIWTLEQRHEEREGEGGRNHDVNSPDYMPIDTTGEVLLRSWHKMMR
jgi:hypothetical protein